MVAIVGDDVGGGCTWVLDLDTAVRGKGAEGDGTIVVEGVGAVLPVDEGLDTGGVGGVGVVLVLDFFKEAVVCAGECQRLAGKEDAHIQGIGDAAVVGIVEFHLCGYAYILRCG